MTIKRLVDGSNFYGVSVIENSGRPDKTYISDKVQKVARLTERESRNQEKHSTKNIGGVNGCSLQSR
jgi:hypothetical protein